MRVTLTLLLAAAVLAGGCQPQSTPDPDPQPAAKKFPTPDDPAMRKRAPDRFQVKFTTSAGDVIMELHRPWAPHGVDRFYNLVTNGFYDDTRIFRVVPDFVVQFGVSGDPAVSRDWFEAGFPDDPVRQMNTAGMVTFAKTKLPRSRTTQVFVNTGDNSETLDRRGFAPIGRVVEGLDLLKRLKDTRPEAHPRGQSPDQGMIAGQGNQYLDLAFPKLCRIVSAKVVE